MVNNDAEVEVLGDGGQGGGELGWDGVGSMPSAVGGRKHRGSRHRTRKGKKGKEGKKGKGSSSSSSSKKSKKVKKSKSGKKGKASGWINHVKQYAKANGIKFNEALKDKNCGAEYKRNK